MNICFFTGKIVSEIQFDFILYSRNVSIVIFELELENKSIIKVKGYDEIADWCYRYLVKVDVISIYGEINSNLEIILLDIQ